MTHLMDKFFVSIGLDSGELEASENRGLLYVGIIFMSGVGVAFGVMSLLS